MCHSFSIGIRMLLRAINDNIELNRGVVYKKNYKTSTNENLIHGLMSPTQLNGEYMKKFILKNLF